jgi:hypothetical protein
MSRRRVGGVRRVAAPCVPVRAPRARRHIGCVGLVILATPCVGFVAIAAFSAYTQSTVGNRLAEASATVPVLANAVTHYCQRMHDPGASPFPDAMGPTLTTPGSAAQMPTVDPRWHTLEFGPNRPQYYAYSIERPDASSLRVLAEGDLDDDGVRSRYEVACTAVGPQACTCGELVVTNEYE